MNLTCKILIHFLGSITSDPQPSSAAEDALARYQVRKNYAVRKLLTILFSEKGRLEGTIEILEKNKVQREKWPEPSNGLPCYKNSLKRLPYVI